MNGDDRWPTCCRGGLPPRPPAAVINAGIGGNQVVARRNTPPKPFAGGPSSAMRIGATCSRSPV
jgi:hypothetical protein